MKGHKSKKSSWFVKKMERMEHKIDKLIESDKRVHKMMHKHKR